MGSSIPAKKTVIRNIAEQLGFSRAEFEQMEALVRNHHGRGDPGTTAVSIEAAYQVLGISESASDAEIKKAYRRLMSQHHPDKLVSKRFARRNDADGKGENPRN